MTGSRGRNMPEFKGARGAIVSGSLHSRAPVTRWGEVAVARGPQAPRAALAPASGYMAAIRAPSHQAGACGASGLCSRSGTHSRAPAAGSAVFALGCTRDRRRSRRNQGMAPQNSRALILVEQFSWVGALAKYLPAWRPAARAGPNTARASRLPSHCVASPPPFRSGRRLPRTNDVCRRTPAAAS